MARPRTGRGVSHSSGVSGLSDMINGRAPWVCRPRKLGGNSRRGFAGARVTETSLSASSRSPYR